MTNSSFSSNLGIYSAPTSASSNIFGGFVNPGSTLGTDQPNPSFNGFGSIFSNNLGGRYTAPTSQLNMNGGFVNPRQNPSLGTMSGGFAPVVNTSFGSSMAPSSLSGALRNRFMGGFSA